MLRRTVGAARHDGDSDAVGANGVVRVDLGRVVTGHAFTHLPLLTKP